MSLQWNKEASQAAADLMNEKSSLDYVLFSIPNPKQAKPEVVLESKGIGGRQAVFDYFCKEESAQKVLTGAFVVSAVDEKGSVTSVRRKLVHVTFAGGQVGVMTKGKLNGWSGPFRDPFPGCATYLQLTGGADELDDLQEGDLQATLMAAGGATRYDFSNQTLRGSVGLPEAAPAPAPAPIVATKKFKMPVATPPPPEPTPEPEEPPKLTKSQEAMQKMKAHKESMKKVTPPPEEEEEKEPTPPPEEPEFKMPENTEGLEFVMLLSSQSGSNEQASNMRSSQQILKSLGIEPKIIDGADPNNKKKRDKLFRMSGVRGNYPQFFVVQKNKMATVSDDEDDDLDEKDLQFFGDFNVLNEKKQQGTLAKEIGLGSDALGALAEQEDSNEPSSDNSNKKVVLLISTMCNAAVLANQNHAQAVIEGLGIDKSNRLELLDGCDANLRDRRNQLWEISGKRAEYPQLFLVDEASSEIQFVGDYENIMFLHDQGSLPEQLGV